LEEEPTFHLGPMNVYAYAEGRDLLTIDGRLPVIFAPEIYGLSATSIVDERELGNTDGGSARPVNRSDEPGKADVYDQIPTNHVEIFAKGNPAGETAARMSGTKKAASLPEYSKSHSLAPLGLPDSRLNFASYGRPA
jgi:hypothetical protein